MKFVEVVLNIPKYVYRSIQFALLFHRQIFSSSNVKNKHFICNSNNFFVGVHVE
jgi:hypothetical protein